MSEDSVSPPIGLTENLISKVHRELSPSAWKVFLKFGAIHSVVGSFTLALCPQFGVGTTHGLMQYFMQLGPRVCMVACGILFLGISAIVSAWLLRPEEVRVVKRNLILQLTLLSTASLGVLLCLGANILIKMALFWLIGTLLGGLGSFEIGRFIRNKFQDRPVFG